MFKFSNFKKLFSYNWSQVIKDAVPKGNNSLIQDEAFKDIMNGAIVRILAVVFSKIAAIGIAIYTVVKAYGWLYGNEIMSYALSVALTDNIGKWIIEIITASIIPIIILVYINIMKKKNQNAWPYFIVLIISLLQTLYSLWGCFGWFTSFLINPIFAIIGLASVFLVLLGNVHIAVGCVDYCLKSTSEYKAQNPTQNTYQPTPNQTMNQTNTYAQGTNIQNINQHQIQPQPVPNVEQNPTSGMTQNNTVTQMPQQQFKFCNQCGTQLAVTTSFCPNCGNKM